VKRAGIDPAIVEQVVGGCVTRRGNRASNVTRTLARQNLPYEVAPHDRLSVRLLQQANNFINNSSQPTPSMSESHVVSNP